MKTVWAAWTFAGIVAAGAWWALLEYADGNSHWLLLIPLVAFIPAAKMHLGRRTVTLRLHDDHLTLESGFLSRARRTVDMAKIQDVTVNQTLGQRILGTGDIMLESAGESGAMSVRNIDRPRVIADAILNTSKKGKTFF